MRFWTFVIVTAALRQLPAQADRTSVAGPDHVDITWMSITNMYYELGPLHILTDGHFTRLPQSLFYAGGGSVDSTHESATPDVAAVRRVFTALGGRSSVNLLLTGHSHFDHSFDTPTWAKLSGARIIGSETTCFQAIASGVPVNQCLPVDGGEKSRRSTCGSALRASTSCDSSCRCSRAAAKIHVLTPLQYMDTWRLDRGGVRPIVNDSIKKALGFPIR
jgi:hypothetical protein